MMTDQFTDLPFPFVTADILVEEAGNQWLRRVNLISVTVVEPNPPETE